MGGEVACRAGEFASAALRARDTFTQSLAAELPHHVIARRQSSFTNLTVNTSPTNDLFLHNLQNSEKPPAHVKVPRYTPVGDCLLRVRSTTMATNGHTAVEQAIAPVLAAYATTSSNADDQQKKMAFQFLEQFQKGVSAPGKCERNSQLTNTPRPTPGSLHLQSCNPRPYPPRQKFSLLQH